jgi:hypothetical protein
MPKDHKGVFMRFLHLFALLLVVPAFLFAAGDNNYKITLDKFKVGAKMEPTAGQIIDLPKGVLSIQPGFPLKENTIYLRQKKGSKEYKWFAGTINSENFVKVHAFSLSENRLKVGEVVLMRFYATGNSKAFQDETDIYFDKEYIYSTRLPKLFFFKNGRWQLLKESETPSIIELNWGDGKTEIASEDISVKKGVRYLHPVDAGLYTFIFMKDGCMPYAEMVSVKSASVQVVAPKLVSAAVSGNAAPKLSVNKQMLDAAANLQETEELYDRFTAETQGEIKSADSSAFYKFYPKQKSASAFMTSPSSMEYRNYVARYTSKRNEAYGMWKKGQNAEVVALETAFKHKFDSLQALESRMYVWPNTVNPVYPIAVPEYSAELSPASVQMPDQSNPPAPLQEPPAPVAQGAEPAAQPEAPQVPAEKIELVIGHPGDRYDFKWTGKALGMDAENLITLIRAGKVNMIVSLQNDKPVWIYQNDAVSSRHHYRYVKMEFEFGGQIYPGEGDFILPSYILKQTEVQDWLHPKPVESSSSAQPVSSSSSVPELIVIPPSSSSEDSRIIHDAFHGDVVMIDSGSFRYKGRVVDMSPFAIHATEVTQKFFAEVMSRRDSAQRVEDRSKFKGDMKPVHNVTWTVAKEFCEQLGGDLPSEAQWEFAGRADNNEGALWVLDDVPDPSNYAVYRDNSYKLGKNSEAYGPQPVGKRKPNAWGLSDMSGNVAEWTRDRHFPISFWQERSNPTGSMFGYLRVFKGGSWKDSEKDINLVETDDEDPRYWSDRIGFRCVFPQKAIQKKDGK